MQAKAKEEICLPLCPPLYGGYGRGTCLYLYLLILFFAISSCIGIFSPQLFSQKLEPTPQQALLSVTVVNEKQQPQTGEQVFFESVKTKKVFEGVTKENGMFDILVPKGDKYNVKYKTFTTDADYAAIDVPDIKNELLSFEITIQYELPKVYTLDNVYFDTGKSTLRAESFKELNELAEFMRQKKTLVIEIAGHTDNVGSAESNLKLSEGRANAVRDYLIRKGIKPERIIAKGYGDTQPVANNTTDEGKQKNRRTEVRVVKE